MPRDDFRKSVIDRLRMRVSNRCSNPACRVPTTGPSGNEDKVNVIGIAAHITAASIGGPRYSSQINSEQRKSINNAIWLCANCATEIDRDVDTYGVEFLNKWKEDAEALAKNELGRKLPEKSDAINTVSAALTGLPKSFLATAISNVHRASEKSLESLDPRFTVKSAHTESGTIFSLHPKEDVSITMRVSGEEAINYTEKYNSLIEHGEDVEINAGALEFDGSELISEISNIYNGGKLVISRQKEKGIQKLWLKNKESGIIETFEDIVGKVNIGSKSFSFEGDSCDGMFTFKYRKKFDANDAKITFGLHLGRWEDCDVRYLPYFTKIFSLFKRLADGWELFTALEIEGKPLVTSNGMDASNMDFVNETNVFLHYIEKVSIISNFTGKLINFTSDLSFTREEINRLSEIAQIICGEAVYFSQNISSNVLTQLVADEGANNIEKIKNISRPMDIKISENSNESVRCFGATIILPAKIISVNNAIPKIPDIECKYKKGDIVQVEWIPSTGFKFRIDYQKA